MMTLLVMCPRVWWLSDEPDSHVTTKESPLAIIMHTIDREK